MKTSTRIALGAVLAVTAAVALPAIGQDRPESLLPPGFGDPVPTPTPSPTASRAPSANPVPGAAPEAMASPLPGTPTPSPTPTATPTPIDLSAYELPDFARRSLDAVGPVDQGAGLLGADAFGTANGRTLEILMRRLDAPLPSRWLSIALRRALISRVATPPGVGGADFAAERAWLLLRMGEADSARAVVQSVDVENYTPKLFQVAMQAMLANADPAGLCPLVEPVTKFSAEPGWAFARAMCAGLEGEPARAGALLNAARRISGRGIDYSLAEKVVGAGSGGRRSVTVEWDGVDRLTAWRFGLAGATGVEIPESLYSGTAPGVQGWRATVPMTDVRGRAAASDFAASQGILSNLALVDLFGEVEASDDTDSAEGATARDLRAAYSEGTEEQRLQTLRRLWDAPKTRHGRYARLVLTSRAAARIAPTAERASDADRLIASMLTAGFDRGIQRWAAVLPAASDGWAMLMLADPSRRVATYGDVDSYQDRDASAGRLKARMLLAGLTGLGRLSAEDAQSLAEPLDVRFGAETSWTRAIAAAATRREPGTVLLLTAVGMQTGDWRGVPPETLYHATSALRAVGLDGAARMIAAEAIARL